MKRLALFRCCVTSLRLQHYESATDAVLGALGVVCDDLKAFGCCGYPLKNFDLKAYLLAAARNLALAEKNYLDITTSCNCCYGSLKQAQQMLAEDAGLLREINAMLSKEGLYYRREVQVFSLLETYHELMGAGAIQKRLKATYDGLQVATHYGCHLLRPSNVVAFDHPLAPKKFDALVALTGAQSIPWDTKLECCGSPMAGVNDTLAESLGRAKLDAAGRAGAALVCVICPYCQIQFDWIQARAEQADQADGLPPALYYHQLLGLCLGIDPRQLGLTDRQLQAAGLQAALRPVAKEPAAEASPAA
ncbi:MAG: CoB--CoM heterodisulfide reductase iron-sulfur subunit B family protein [Desulfobacteraceae bacterium]|jgi:heterodisulfide reductase subunit B